MWIGIYIYLYRHFRADCYLLWHNLTNNYGLLGTLIYEGVKLDGDDSSDSRFFIFFLSLRHPNNFLEFFFIYPAVACKTISR